jgi:hypothetical protein
MDIIKERLILCKDTHPKHCASKSNDTTYTKLNYNAEIPFTDLVV